MRRPNMPTVALALVLAVPANAAEKVTSYDRFKLWNGCKPLDLVVERVRKNADVQLTEEAITVAVRSRLRAGRLYKADDLSAYLYVNVNVGARAFAISIDYFKWLNDPASGKNGYAATWHIGSAGTHGKDSGYILSGVSQHVDKFIDEYLRVNADACRNSN